MAKDGTRRGGRRVRAGDKPKALSDKIAEGKDAEIIEFHAPELDAADKLIKDFEAKQVEE